MLWPGSATQRPKLTHRSHCPRDRRRRSGPARTRRGGPGARKDYRSAQNAAAGGRHCETSIWIGAYYGASGSDPKPSIFKSWAAHRATEPAELLAERRYLHPLSTPRSLGAARDMMAFQGDRNLYFAGSFTTLTDLQETSLYSGMKVAESLNPDGPELASFQQRLADEDLLGISYDVP